MKLKFTIILIMAAVLISCNYNNQKNQESSNEQISSAKQVSEEKIPYTSTHVFKAEYKGYSFHKCMGKTALCPEKCGESGNLANFKVIEYKTFVVNGEAGSEKLTDFNVLISDYDKKDLDRPYVPVIKSLKEGDMVLIHVNYVYDTTKSTVQTETNIESIEKIN